MSTGARGLVPLLAPLPMDALDAVAAVDAVDVVDAVEVIAPLPPRGPASTSAGVRHRGRARQAGGDDGAGRVGVPHDALQVPAGEEAVAEGAAEGVAGAEAVDDVDRERAAPRRWSPSRWTARTPFGPCLTTASSTPASRRARAAACGSRYAGGDLALVEVADGDRGVAQGLGRRRGAPSSGVLSRTWGASRGRRPSYRHLARWPRAARVAVRLGSSLRPVPVTQKMRGLADRVQVQLVGVDLEVGRLGLPVEVQREVVRREDLAEGDRGVEAGDRRDPAVVDAEVPQRLVQIARRRGRHRCG